ncbi:MAG: 7-cyano-7-deazaguanine synthase QueC [Marinilabiliaceae bacterium]|nr:7-cyano-7-deazaguanine synthase QueC [Marinilabiliaceae bacterium]
MKKAVILLSGGLDSAVVLWLARSKGYELYTLSFDYGQKHLKELESAKKLAELAGVKLHQIITLKLDQWGGSSLTDISKEIENGNLKRNEAPSTYVPARNMIFLSIAASFAETIGASDIFIGVSEVDYSGYVDCRKEFIDAMQNAINKGTESCVTKKSPITIQAPFIDKTKTEEILLALELGVPIEHTWSCYKGGDVPCGKCDSCLLREKAFKEAEFRY